jgi:cytoskeletal protein RodZ
MKDSEVTQLRGFDSYRVTLGDEMRGLRASMGKSLLDVQRDLRIKAAHIAALENADASAVPHRGYVTGYLRAYARYLGMDEEDVLRRFCEEAAFEPANARSGTLSAARSASIGRSGRRDDLDAAIAGSRLAAASRAASYNGDLGATLRGLGAIAALAALVGGLGYGGWALLENIQRVDFAQRAEAPDAVAEAPEFGAIGRIMQASAAAPIIDAAALAAVYAAQEAPPPEPPRRDGPIAALNPERAGVYGRAPIETPPSVGDVFEAAVALESGAVDRFGLPVARTTPAEANLAALAETAPPPAPKGLRLVFAEEAWVRIRDGAGAVVHEALMRAGGSWRAPEGAEGLTIRAGNAGGVFVAIEGALYGPLGGPGEVVSSVSLNAESIVKSLEPADGAVAPLLRVSDLAEARVSDR